MFCWESLQTPNPKADIGFYKKVYGWTESTFGDAITLGTGEGMVNQFASVTTASSGMPTSWTTYVAVDSLSGARDQVKRLGGASWSKQSRSRPWEHSPLSRSRQGSHLPIRTREALTGEKPCPYAKDHDVLVVQRQRRGGGQLLHLHFQGFEDPGCDALRRRRTRTKGSVMTMTFQLNGQEFIALNGGPHFKFTEAISLFVKCDTQQEVDELWTKLTTGGGSESQCGWLKDKYGLSWQIVPSGFLKMMVDKRSREVEASLRRDDEDEEAGPSGLGAGIQRRVAHGPTRLAREHGGRARGGDARRSSPPAIAWRHAPGVELRTSTPWRPREGRSRRARAPCTRTESAAIVLRPGRYCCGKCSVGFVAEPARRRTRSAALVAPTVCDRLAVSTSTSTSDQGVGAGRHSAVVLLPPGR